MQFVCANVSSCAIRIVAQFVRALPNFAPEVQISACSQSFCDGQHGRRVFALHQHLALRLRSGQIPGIVCGWHNPCRGHGHVLAARQAMDMAGRLPSPDLAVRARNPAQAGKFSAHLPLRPERQAARTCYQRASAQGHVAAW